MQLCILHIQIQVTIILQNKYVCVFCYICIGSSILSYLPPNLLHYLKSTGDHLVAKASQLIQNKTTNTENLCQLGDFH